MTGVLQIALAVTIAAVLTEIFHRILKFQLRLFFLLIVLEVCVAVVLVIYGRDVYENYRELEKAGQVPTDTILEKEIKEVKFDDKTLENDTVSVREVRKISNNMTQENKPYRTFFREIHSSEDFPEEVDLKVEDKRVKPRNEENYKQPKGGMKVKTFDIPLDIESGESKEFEINYRTKAFKKVIKENEPDFLFEKVNRVTNELEFKILLTEDMKDKYKLAKSSKGLYSYEVYDSSEEQMESTEQELMGNDMIPKFQGDRIIWRIKNPKIGYKYCLYFEFLKKDLT